MQLRVCRSTALWCPAAAVAFEGARVSLSTSNESHVEKKMTGWQTFFHHQKKGACLSFNGGLQSTLIHLFCPLTTCLWLAKWYSFSIVISDPCIRSNVCITMCTYPSACEWYEANMRRANIRPSPAEESASVPECTARWIFEQGGKTLNILIDCISSCTFSQRSFAFNWMCCTQALCSLTNIFPSAMSQPQRWFST